MKKTSIITLLWSLAAFADGIIIEPPTLTKGAIAGRTGHWVGNGGSLSNVPLNAATGTVANVSMPTNYFGEMRIIGTVNHGTFLADNTFRNITNYNESDSYGCTLSVAKGYITNNVAGYWTGIATPNFGASDVENYNVEFATNDVPIASSLANVTVGAAGFILPTIATITLYLPANTRVSVAVYTDVETQSGVVGAGTFRLEKK